MLIISSLCSVISALSYSIKLTSFFHQNVTTVEFYFYVIIACCLLLAADWARKGLATEILSENSFGQALFHCGPVQGTNSGRVTRVLRHSISAKLQLQLQLQIPPLLSASLISTCSSASGT